MRTVSLACVLAVALTACKSDPHAKPPPPSGVDVVATGSNDTMVVQPGRSEDGTIGFAITKVIPKQRPTDTAPFHADGGDWTYAEAHLDGDAQATFVVGIPVFTSSDGPGFSKIMLVPTTAASGARVIKRLAAGLGVDAPPPITGGTLQPMEIPVAVLGHNIGRDGGGYSGSGWWDATKLFCSSEDVDSAELFFNISTADFRGEFSRKDVDYDADAVACLAVALEGAPPPRTPANDPTMAATGPHLEVGTRISGPRLIEIALTPARAVLLEERVTSAAILALDVATGATKELYTTKDRLDGGGCDDTATRCVIKVSKPKERSVMTGTDPASLIVLDGDKLSPVSATALGDHPDPAAHPISPDGTIVVATVYAKPAFKLVAWNLKTHKAAVLSGGDDFLEVAAWTVKGGKPVLIVTRNDYSTADGVPVVLEWDPVAGGPAAETKDAPPPAVSPTSPDGSRHAEFTKDGKLTITAGSQTRTLAFQPQDVRWATPDCCAWIDNRYLEFRTGFIDTDAMKIFFPPKRAGADDDRVTYIPGSHTALVHRDDGVYLATLVIPDR